MRAAQVVTPTGPAGVEVREIDEPSPGPDDVLIEVHRVGISFPDLLLSKGQYQLKPEPPFTLGVDVAGRVVVRPRWLLTRRPGRGRAPARWRCRAGRLPGAVRVPAAGQRFVRRRRGHPDELPHRPLRAGRAGRAAPGRDRAGPRRRRRRRHRHPAGRPRARRPHRRRGLHRGQGARSRAGPAPTTWCCSTASARPSPSSPAAAASTSSWTSWEVTCSPTRCGRWHRRGADGRRVRRRARASPRSR